MKAELPWCRVPASLFLRRVALMPHRPAVARVHRHSSLSIGATASAVNGSIPSPPLAHTFPPRIVPCWTLSMAPIVRSSAATTRRAERVLKDSNKRYNSGP